jgi:hypothetical protein
MPKPSPAPKHDPMSGVVDRLLAQLPGLQGEPASTPRVTTAGRWSSPTVMLGNESVHAGALLAVWARVLLGLALGIMLGGWPYQQGCGQPLAGYLGSVVVLGLAALWAACAAWKQRAALAHVIALITLFYGILLAAAEVLPRTGYASQHAEWQCEGAVVSSVVSRSALVGLHQLSKG